MIDATLRFDLGQRSENILFSALIRLFDVNSATAAAVDDNDVVDDDDDGNVDKISKLELIIRI